jgi:hypothetical protein
MKLRLHGDSLRLRLSQSDVEALKKNGQVEEEILFASGRMLVYSVESGAAIGAQLDGSHIRVTLPSLTVAQWIGSDQVGIEGMSGPLRVIVEKDFQCLHREGEEAADSDSFPNPLAE